MMSAEVTKWKDSSEFAWGAEGVYASTDSCVGDPYASPSAGFNPTGITYATIPSSYDVFVIDGDDY